MFESLEDRRLLTVVGLPGLVIISGSNAADNISVTGAGGAIVVSGTAGSGTFANVKTMLINSYGGSDSIAIADTVTASALINAGAGDDTVKSGGGNDNIQGGDGNDDLDGGSGNDAIIAGAGADKVNGGAGKDVILASGDRGIDTIVKDSSDVVLKDKNDILA